MLLNLKQKNIFFLIFFKKGIAFRYLFVYNMGAGGRKWSKVEEVLKLVVRRV